MSKKSLGQIAYEEYRRLYNEWWGSTPAIGGAWQSVKPDARTMWETTANSVKQAIQEDGESVFAEFMATENPNDRQPQWLDKPDSCGWWFRRLGTGCVDVVLVCSKIPSQVTYYHKICDVDEISDFNFKWQRIPEPVLPTE